MVISNVLESVGTAYCHHSRWLGSHMAFSLWRKFSDTSANGFFDYDDSDSHDSFNARTKIQTPAPPSPARAMIRLLLYYISHWGECNFTYFMNKSICDSSLIVIIHHKNNNLNCNSNFCVLHNKTGDFMTWTFEPPSRCYDINFWSRHRSFWSSSWRLSSPPSLGSLMNFFPKYKNNYKNI